MQPLGCDQLAGFLIDRRVCINLRDISIVCVCTMSAVYTVQYKRKIASLHVDIASVCKLV